MDMFTQHKVVINAAPWDPQMTKNMDARTTHWFKHKEKDENPEKSARIGGSAILVRGKWGQGILTAEHCIRWEPDDVLSISGRSTSTTSPSGTKIFLVPQEMLERAYKWKNTGDRKEGPDLAFVPLGKNILSDMEGTTGAIFHNVDNDWSRDPLEYDGCHCLYFAVGHVGSDGREAEEVKGLPEGSIHVQRIAQVGIVPGSKQEIRDGADYMSLRVTTSRHDHTSTFFDLGGGSPEYIKEISVAEPKSWGGISGCGVWWNTRDKQEKEDFGLCGMVYYEYPNPDLQEMHLYAHGKLSLKKIIKDALETNIDFTPPIERVYSIPLSSRR